MGKTKTGRSAKKNSPKMSNLNFNELNDYSDRKSYAKGLVDIALLTANANQLKHAIAIDDLTYKIVNICLVITSITLQIVAGIILILDHRIKVNTKEDLKAVTRYTTAIQMLMFCIIILNILIVALADPGPKN